MAAPGKRGKEADAIQPEDIRRDVPRITNVHPPSSIFLQFFDFLGMVLWEQVKQAKKLLPYDQKLYDTWPKRSGKMDSARNQPRQGGFGGGGPYQRVNKNIPSAYGPHLIRPDPFCLTEISTNIGYVRASAPTSCARAALGPPACHREQLAVPLLRDEV
jgi:hypothetical protein